MFHFCPHLIFSCQNCLSDAKKSTQNTTQLHLGGIKNTKQLAFVIPLLAIGSMNAYIGQKSKVKFRPIIELKSIENLSTDFIV